MGLEPTHPRSRARWRWLVSSLMTFAAGRIFNSLPSQPYRSSSSVDQVGGGTLPLLSRRVLGETNHAPVWQSSIRGQREPTWFESWTRWRDGTDILDA